MEIYFIELTDPNKPQRTEFINELINGLYENKMDFISEDQRKELGLPEDYFKWLKRQISKYDERVPLYDIAFNHVFLIHKDNIFRRVYRDHYRFIGKKFYHDMLSIEQPEESDVEIIRFLSFYDLDKLEKVLMRLFYQSFVLDKYITTCKRPSYKSGMEHISPYYNSNELYYLAADWDLIKENELSTESIEKLCTTISAYDIPAKTLLDHQMYIYEKKAIGLVKYYSLHGSYYINDYLRKTKCCIEKSTKYTKNDHLENQIKIMVDLISKSPPFQKDHTVYRFVENDSYMGLLKPGDEYIDPSFMSTTRNPFNYQANYGFGYILIKIKIPSGISGIGLCIESYSNFPDEQEIILLPTSRYRLIKVVDKKNVDAYQHIMKRHITKKYEVEWVGNGLPISIESENKQIKLNNLDLKTIVRDMAFDSSLVMIANRINFFREEYIKTPLNQFITTVGTKDYLFVLESYDSTSVYKKFFYYSEPNGIMITSTNKKHGNINIIIEIGDEIHVNYYFRYSVTDTAKYLKLDSPEWVEWLSCFAYIMGCRKVIIHSSHLIHYDPNASVKSKQEKSRYTYPNDIYQYLKNDKKIFDDNINVSANFDYAQLNVMRVTDVKDVFNVDDRDEIYRIAVTSGIDKLSDFYVFIAENHPKLLELVENKLDRLFSVDQNPFTKTSYTIDAWGFLMDNKIISVMPSEKQIRIKKGSFKKVVKNNIDQFTNRIRTFLGK